MSQVSAFVSGGADEVPTAWNVGKFGMVVGIEPNAAAEIREEEKKEEQRAEGGGEKEVKVTVSQH